MADYTVTEKTGTAIQAAVDAAHNAGGGRVCLEPGVYLSGTICLKSNVELHLPAGAEIKGFPIRNSMTISAIRASTTCRRREAASV